VTDRRTDRQTDRRTEFYDSINRRALSIGLLLATVVFGEITISKKAKKVGRSRDREN